MATQVDLDAINKAIASGHRVVQYNGKRVEYHSMDDLIKAKQQIAAELNRGPRACGGLLSDRIVLGAYDRG